MFDIRVTVDIILRINIHLLNEKFDQLNTMLFVNVVVLLVGFSCIFHGLVIGSGWKKNYYV